MGKSLLKFIVVELLATCTYFASVHANEQLENSLGAKRIAQANAQRAKGYWESHAERVWLCSLPPTQPDAVTCVTLAQFRLISRRHADRLGSILARRIKDIASEMRVELTEETVSSLLDSPLLMGCAAAPESLGASELTVLLIANHRVGASWFEDSRCTQTDGPGDIALGDLNELRLLRREMGALLRSYAQAALSCERRTDTRPVQVWHQFPAVPVRDEMRWRKTADSSECNCCGDNKFCTCVCAKSPAFKESRGPDNLRTTWQPGATPQEESEYQVLEVRRDYKAIWAKIKKQYRRSAGSGFYTASGYLWRWLGDNICPNCVSEDRTGNNPARGGIRGYCFADSDCAVSVGCRESALSHALQERAMETRLPVCGADVQPTPEQGQQCFSMPAPKAGDEFNSESAREFCERRLGLMQTHSDANPCAKIKLPEPEALKPDPCNDPRAQCDPSDPRTVANIALPPELVLRMRPRPGGQPTAMMQFKE